MGQNVLLQKAQYNYINENTKLLTIEEIKEALQPLCKKYHIQSVILFGSYSKGNATGESDIDLVVEYDSDTKAFVRMEFMDDVETVFGKKIDFINIRVIPEMLKNDIEKEGILLYETI